MLRRRKAGSSAGSEISAEHGPAVLALPPRSTGLPRTGRLVETPGIIARRKEALAVAIAALPRSAAVHRAVVAAVVRRTVAADLTAEDTADSRNLRSERATLLTIFPRPGRVLFPAGPLFLFTKPQLAYALSPRRAENLFPLPTISG